MKEVFYSANNHTLEQPPQGCRGAPSTEGFQDTTGLDNLI